MKTVIIASYNPVKIDATRSAFGRMFVEEALTFECYSADSGVPDQPMSDTETLLGAKNRAYNTRSGVPKADYWIGIEGGIENTDNGMLSFAWVYIIGQAQEGYGRSASFFLPPQVASLIKEGKELGEADDIVFGQTNSKQKNGAIGILTHDVITRRDLYEPAIITALIPFVHHKLYP